MESVFEFVALRNQPGIQTMATIFFTFHSLFLMGQMFAIMGSTDIMMHLKLASIDTSILEICLVLVPRMLMLFATIVVDLVLVIGIEDVKILLGLLGAYTTFLVAKGVCAYRVRKYARTRLAGSSPKVEEEHEEHQGDEMEATTSFIKSVPASDSTATSPSEPLHRRSVKGREHELEGSVDFDDVH
ncbi:uncharacterized protein [Dermacentor andersoni]|uniref:uncharacterized protein isoform X2 n=1 Tax=Dermacentor andersoni TaxID=34620 RepID=UPI003B3AFA25